MINFKRLHHIQLCIPIGDEDKARDFYGRILQLKEKEKPEALKKNGGLWFDVGDIELHLGVESINSSPSKRHPAFEVENILEVKEYLKDRGVKIKEEIAIPNIERFTFTDPFGNRIEFMETT
ncbi:VOC family protein [Sutcliffiella cohnii]|uniref:Glyoxalase n=1 Tax=Sutcliffiella cohnii TaxID=33932 RepID=A0A223KQH9_9BACI|nr:glyoxalase [Sutcliffiella cohnii]